MSNSMKSLKIAIIGAGAVGTQLGMALRSAGFQIEAVVSRTKRSAGNLARRLGCRHFGSDPALVADANLIILCVPGVSLKALAGRLATVAFADRRVILAHTAGNISHNVLWTAKKNKSCQISVVAIHPIQAFPSKRRHASVVEGIYFGVEGEPRGIRVIQRIISSIGAFMIRVPSDGKALYHVGAVVVSNFVVALMSEAVRLYGLLGIPPEKTVEALYPLAARNLQNVKSLGPGRALTGPAARGDTLTIRQHVTALRRHDPSFVKTYESLTELCLRLSKRTNRGSRP